MPTSRAFSYGEISPSLQKRVDLESYQRSAKTLRNWKVLREGGIETRPGTTLVAPTKYATTASRNVVLRPFVFNSDSSNTYVLEIGHEYIRFHKNGAQVRETAQAITGISAANPGVVTYTGADPTAGDEVYISGVYGMVEVNGWYIVGTVDSGANTFELLDRDGGNINTTNFTTYTSGGTFEPVYEITTDYDSDDVHTLSLAQLNDVVVIVREGYRPATLTRSGDTSWAFTRPFATSPLDTRVSDMTATAGAAGSKTFKYKITYDVGDGESYPGAETAKLITNITNAEPPVVTCAAHGYSDGDTVIIDLVGGGMGSRVSGREYTIGVATPFVADTPIAITSITTASPMVVTKNSHGLLDGDKILFSSMVGMTELDAIEYGTVVNKTANTFEVYYFGTTTLIDSTGFQAFTSGYVTRISPNPTAVNTFQLRNEDSTDWGSFTTGGGMAQVARSTLYLTGAADATSTAPHSLSWGISNVQGLIAGLAQTVREYTIYKDLNGNFGFLGTSTSRAFSDVGATPDTADGPRVYQARFIDEDDYPYCCGFGKQRLWFGGSNNHPNRVTSSIAGSYLDFSTREPMISSDTVTIDLVGQTANIVRGVKEVAGRVVAFCSEGEFGLGDDDGVIDANNPDAKHFSSVGSTTLPPLLVNEIATQVQARSSQVRDFGYNFESNSYKGNERSIRNSHLFKGHTIVDWCFQQVPDSIIWAARDDGVLLGCTYVREEQMAAWHRHDIQDAEIESVCSIPGSEGDEVYLVVNHTIGADTFKYVERMASRFISDVVENVFTDASVVYDGRNTSAIQMKLTGGSAWTAGESMTAQTDTAYFNARGAENVGNSVFLYDSDGEVIKGIITAYTDSTHVTVTPDRDVPAAMQSTYVTTWSYAQPYIDGMWPLEGADVSVFADGFIEASANNDVFGTPLTVTDGRVTLSQPFAYITAGIPITCDVETLDIDAAQVPGGGLLNRNKVVNKLYVAVEDTGGLYAGTAPPSDDDADPLENLQPLQGREVDQSYDATTGLDTMTYDPDMIAGWNTHGRVFIRQVDPLPARILAIMPDGQTGGT